MAVAGQRQGPSQERPLSDAARKGGYRARHYTGNGLDYGQQDG